MSLTKEEKKVIDLTLVHQDTAGKVGDQIDADHGGPADATFTIGSESSDVINVAIQFNDADGNECAERVSVPWYLSDDAEGDALATAPTGGIAIGTDGLLIETLADQAGLMVSESDGDVDVDITDTGTPTFYIVLVMPSGKLVVSDAITFA